MNQYMLHIEYRMMTEVLNNITDSHYDISYLRSIVCLSEQEIVKIDTNKFKFTSYGDILQYVCSCDKLNIINASVIFYLDEALLEKNILLKSTVLCNYMMIRFLNNDYENEWGDWEDCYPFLRISLFMTNELHVNYDDSAYMSALDCDITQDSLTLVEPTTKNARILNYIEDMTFLDNGGEVDPNMHDNTLNYISASSEYVTKFANNVNTDTSNNPDLIVKNNTVCSLWFMLHSVDTSNNKATIMHLLDQYLHKNDYEYLEYIWEYSYSHNYTDIVVKCAKYVNKLELFIGNGYSKITPTFFDYIHKIASDDNCLTPEFMSFISIRRIMLLFNNDTIEIITFKKLFESYYVNLCTEHKLTLAVYAAYISTIAPFSQNKRDVIYPLLHQINYTSQNLDNTHVMPFADFFYYTSLVESVPETDSNYISWICTKNTNMIEYMLTAHSPSLRNIINKKLEDLFVI